MLKAVTAASTPLFPKSPPLLAIDCSFVSSVKTQKMVGVSVKILQSLIPCATASHTKSKCGV